MEWWSLILIVVAALTIAFLSGVTLFAWRFTKNTFTRHRFSKTTSKRNRKKLVSNESDYYKFLKAATERLNDYIPENLEILSDDGLKLVGYYYRTMNLSLKTVIGVHGYCGDAKKDLASVVPFLLEAGYNVLLVDNRAHGNSEGNIIGFGITDRFDILKWISYIIEKTGSDSIFLYGISMGASAIMLAARFKLPPQVKGIVADCGFTSPYMQFKYLFAKIVHLPEFPVMPMVRAFAKRYAGYDILSADTRRSLAVATVPVFIIHGDRDTFVPLSMSRENDTACASFHELFIVRGAKHAASHYVAGKAYEQAILEFMEKHI